MRSALEVGETLTFSLPPGEGDIVGGQVTITNLFSGDGYQEGALIFAYDSEDRQLASYVAIGNETGEVTVEIDVAFARLDFKALDNDAWLLRNNSNYAVSDVTAMFASVVGALGEDASQLIDDVLAKVDIWDLTEWVDLQHFGTVTFEVSRVGVNTRSSIDALRQVDADQERGAVPPEPRGRVEKPVDQDPPVWLLDQRFAHQS